VKDREIGEVLPAIKICVLILVDECSDIGNFILTLFVVGGDDLSVLVVQVNYVKCGENLTAD
jgi:hypothetical protein